MMDGAVVQTIAVSNPSFCKSQPLREELLQLGCHVIFNETGDVMSRDEAVQFFQNCGAEVVIVGREFIDDSFLESCPKIKFIAKYGVGLDNIDEQALRARNVGLGWTAGVNKRSVSEQVLCFAIGHRRNILSSIHLMEQGTWVKDGGRLLTGTRVGIVGLGNIGQDLVGLLKPFHCDVKYFDIDRKEEFEKAQHVEFSAYHKLVGWSEILTFHVPCTPTTKQMFGSKELMTCNPDLLVINTSRGEIMDYEAVSRAVREHKIAGFAADVFPEEPFGASSYQSTEGFYFTPHIGGNSKEAVSAMGQSAIYHVRKYLEEAGG
jgi:D-3-phosphoglycerate dehydrogenase